MSSNRSKNSIIICDHHDSSLVEYPTHYYYVVDGETTSSVNLKPDDKKYLVTDNDTADEILFKLHENIEDSCNQYNIVLYILLQSSANVENNFIELFNEYLRNLMGVYYSNITVFSYLSEPSYRLILDKELRNNYLTKYCVGSIHKNKHKKIYKIFNVCAFPIDKPGGIPYDNMRFEVITVAESPIDKFGINYLAYQLMPEYRCHFGRLKQIKGTCWLNSLMNSLLLPKISNQIMLQNLRSYQTPNDKLPLTELYAKQNEITIQNMISSIIHNIYVRKIKLPKKNDYNFMMGLANKLKRLICPTHDDREGIIPSKQQHMIEYIIHHYIKPPYSNHYEIVKYTTGDPINMTRGDKKLISCTISIPGHVVCGFICENTEYIFDSSRPNTFFKDNWTSLHFENFSKIIKTYLEILPNESLIKENLEIYSHSPNSIPKIKFLVYCKELYLNKRKLSSTTQLKSTKKRRIDLSSPSLLRNRETQKTQIK